MWGPLGIAISQTRDTSRSVLRNGNPGRVTRWIFTKALCHSLVDDGDGTIVTFAIEYDLKADVPVDPQEVERQDREDLFPLILASLKHYVETGEPMPMPEAAEADTYLKSGS